MIISALKFLFGNEKQLKTIVKHFGLLNLYEKTHRFARFDRINAMFVHLGMGGAIVAIAALANEITALIYSSLNGFLGELVALSFSGSMAILLVAVFWAWYFLAFKALLSRPSDNRE